MLFVDLTAAFDHIEREWLFESIKKRFPDNYNNILIHLIESLYSSTTTALKETQMISLHLQEVCDKVDQSLLYYSIYIWTL